MNKKKIVLFADVLEENFDGVSITLNKVLHSVPKDRFDYLVITSHPPKDIDNFPHELVILPYLKLPFQKGYRLGLPSNKLLKEKLRRFSPDIIHFTSPSLFGKYAIKYARQNNIPVMSIYHTHFPAYIKYYIGETGTFLIGSMINNSLMWYYKNSDLTLVPSEVIKKDLIKRGVSIKSIDVWGRAIKTDSFSPEYRNEDCFTNLIPQNNHKVLFVSRLIKEKETATIAKLYKLLQQKAPHVTMVITGDGPMRGWLEKRMPNALFTGKKIGKELSEIYASCDLFFFPSASETFGNVVIEALASGLPVVAANEGGPVGLVKEGKNGYLVPTGNIEMFYERILNILNNENLKQKMRDSAIKSVQPKTLDSLHKQLWNYYDKAISDFDSKT